MPYDADLGNYAEYSGKLKEIFNAGHAARLYDRLKAAVLAGEISVNTVYLPANDRVFTIMFYHKDISEAVIRAVTGEDVSIVDPLVEHRSDILKAIENSIRVDVFLKDVLDRIFTIDMQRAYLKTRNRNRVVYYGAKELAAEDVTDCRYERLKQVSITFIFENNTTPDAPPVAKVQFMNIETHEIYTDLLTLYEVNLNRITGGSSQRLPEELVILKSFLSVKTNEALREFVETYDTAFSRRLVTEYMNVILDDALLLKVEGSEKFMMKLSEEVLQEERLEGKLEGKLESAISIIRELKITVSGAMRTLRLPDSEQETLVRELERQGIPYAI